MPNRLAEATSPYLLQHKDNPVDWWEWGDEAFQIARDRDVPVLLSVGYAACHWCHVMAHESFEDTDTATVMNERFVNIKVDREERPDVDSIYMEAVQAMSGHGGWPMTVWIDHAGRPFFAGTYFPKEAHHGMASFRQVIDAVSDAWVNRRDDVSEQASRLIGAISSEIPAGDAIDDEMLQSAFTKISSAYDPAHGGFGGAPKFPQQPVLEFLLRVHEQPWASRAGAMLTKTLEKMAAGGIHDQLGGGFARYSVDPHWLVPHFEKMLYDNAQLARLYLWAGVEFGRDDFSEVARKTLDYMTTDLRHREGGFFSSEDADSEGVEGKFYVWTPQEVKEILGDRAVDFMAAYDVTETGNFEGSNILRVVGEVDGFDEERERLFEARSARIRPGLDDKVVAAWNGLAIRAFAEAGATLADPRYVEFARSAANFALEHLMIDGRMMRSWRDGRTSVPGFLDDHAATALGLFALYAATGEETWYSHAIDLVHQFERFGKQGGGFFTTADDSEALVKRPTDIADNPLPSGPGLAAEALLWASLYTGDHDWRDRSAETLAAVGTIASNYPSMVGHHLSVAAVETKELAIVGAGWRDLAAVYWSRYRPGVVLAGSESGSASLPLLAGRQSENGPLAFVCKDFVCDLPTSDSTKLAALLA